MLLEIHRRLAQIKGMSGEVMFGGVSILAIGDLYQLPPVGQPVLFDRMTDAYAKLYALGSLWHGNGRVDRGNASKGRQFFCRIVG